MVSPLRRGTCRFGVVATTPMRGDPRPGGDRDIAPDRPRAGYDADVVPGSRLDHRPRSCPRHRTRATARRACSAAFSALRPKRRTWAIWWPRRRCCASPRRADICARARSSCMRFIFLLPFGWLFIRCVGTFLSARPDRSRGRLVLAGSATRPLAGNHHSLEEELTAPDSPGLATLEGAVEAERPDRAVHAQRLGKLHVGG